VGLRHGLCPRLCFSAVGDDKLVWRGRGSVITIEWAVRAESMAGWHRLPKILARGKARCPVCTREVPRGFIRRGTFPCPTCKQALRFRRVSRLQAAPVVFCGWLLAFLIPYLMGLRGNKLLFATIVLLAPAALAACALVGALIGYLFPRLERDPGGDNGEILHITPPPDRHED